MNSELIALKEDIKNIERQLTLHPPTSGIHKHMSKELKKLQRRLKDVEEGK